MENREAIHHLTKLYDNLEKFFSQMKYHLKEEYKNALTFVIAALENQEQNRWHSVEKEGNPKEEKLYIVTKKLNYGNGVIKYEVSVDRWSRNGFGKEWSYNSNGLIVAWKSFPEPYTEEE